MIASKVVGPGEEIDRIIPFLGNDNIQRIALAWHQKGDESASLHFGIIEPTKKGNYEFAWKENEENFSRHYVSVVDVDRDGLWGIVFDMNEISRIFDHYRTILYIPHQKEIFWQENMRTGEPGDATEKGELKRSKNLRLQKNKKILDWFEKSVNGGTTDQTHMVGGLIDKCENDILNTLVIKH